MTNISFDNPYLLLLVIPLALCVLLPFFIIRNKDNRAVTWTVSVVTHIVIIVLVALAVAGLASTSVLTKTTIYVVADVSYSSSENLDKIDEHIKEIEENLPVNTNLGIVCFGRNCSIITSPGRVVNSVKDAKVDISSTDIVGALNFTEALFDGEALKRIILITDGNDTANNSTGSLASTVERLTENGVRIDAIFLDNSVKEGEVEVQLMETEQCESTYVGSKNDAKFLVQASKDTEIMLELYRRPRVETEEGAEPVEFERYSYTVFRADAGLNTVTMALPTEEGTFEYQVKIIAEGDLSEHNNTRSFSQEIAGKQKILLITGLSSEVDLITSLYGDKAEVSSYVVNASSDKAPFMIEELALYDEIVLSNVDIRNIRNSNAFIDSLDMVVSQYGKSLITMGNLGIQDNRDDPTFVKFAELLPVNYGSANRAGRFYTIVLDVSHSMFMASKFSTAKSSAINLLSVLDDEDYVSVVIFSGEIDVLQPKPVKECKEDYINRINSLTTEHGTDLGLALDDALNRIVDLKYEENHVMIISDGFSFTNEYDAVKIAGDLYKQGATVSAINTYFPADGDGGSLVLKRVVDAGEGGNYYEIRRPEDVYDAVFGTIAEDIADAVIEKEGTVNISKYDDEMAQGFFEFPNVSKYIVSLEKYDATLALTVTYKRDNESQQTIPLYAYRMHGNGKVSTFTSSLSGVWTRQWDDDTKSKFVSNMLVSSTPAKRVDHPFTLEVKYDEFNATIDLIPSVLNPLATTTLRITTPDGRTVTRSLSFDSKKFSYAMTTNMVGTYWIEATYGYDDKTYVTTTSFDIPYLPEYNAFATFDRFTLYEFMRDNGEVAVDGLPNMENNKDNLTTYKVSYTIPLLFAAIVLFVADVFVRKLRIKKKSQLKR
ncbi:MAG: VWA domain-containing protein [Clostridia bacterium]|nr:VWA domain-containing protein [Clostridia bacterium]